MSLYQWIPYILSIINLSATDSTPSKGSTNEVIGIAGRSVTIPCEITPSNPMDAPNLVLWYKDQFFGVPIYSFDMRGGEKSGQHWMDQTTLGDRASLAVEKTEDKKIKAFLKIKNLASEDAGSYRCRVDYNKAPTRNVKVMLRLIELPNPPLIFDSNESILDGTSPPMKINSTLSLSCESDGGNPIPTLFWWEGEERVPISTQDRFSGEEKRLSETRVQKPYRLKRLQRKDQGRLIGCSSSNTDLVPPLEVSFRIDMILPPVGVKILREWSYFLAEKSYSVSCQVFGSRPPPYTKVRIGPRELKSENLEVSSDGEISTTTVNFIPQKSDHGRFLTCRAENPHIQNAAIETQWKIEVHHIPQTKLTTWRNEKNFESNTVEIDTGTKGIKLTCQVDANPKSHAIHWKRNGILIKSEEISSTFRINRTELYVKNVSRNVSGNYTCEAENLLGTGKSNVIRLKVKCLRNKQLVAQYYQFIHEPFCQRNGSVLWYVSINEEIYLPCKVHSYPSNELKFNWTFTSDSTGEEISIIPSKSMEHGFKSTLTFRPLSSKDYGTLHCVAENSFGKQVQPCVFKIKPKGLPRIKSCSLKNSGPDWIRIECALPQIYDIEEHDQRGTNFRIFVTEWSSSKAILNTTLFEGNSDFTIPSLKPGVAYNISITAVNPQGFSEPFHILAQTMSALTTKPPVMIQTRAPRFTADSKTLIRRTTIFNGDLLSQDPIKLLPIIGILAGIVVVLMLIAIIVVVIIRNRSINNDAQLKTHIAFNRTLDLDIDQNNLTPKDKDISYEKLNDVKFEGISSVVNENTMEKKKRDCWQKEEPPDLDFSSIPSQTTTQPLIVIPPKHSTLKKTHSHKEVMFADEVMYKSEPNRMIVYPQYHRSQDAGGIIHTKKEHKDDGYAHPNNLTMSYNDEENHFPFPEAIPAPTTINRLSQIMMMEDPEKEDAEEDILKPTKL